MTEPKPVYDAKQIPAYIVPEYRIVVIRTDGRRKPIPMHMTRVEADMAIDALRRDTESESGIRYTVEPVP